MFSTTTGSSPTAPTAVTAGIIGGGFMAQVHGRAIRAAGARIAGLASSTPASAARAGARLNIPAVDSIDALLADPTIDIVHVCTPNATHADLTLRALEAGKHVVSEKPLATTVADAERVRDTAARLGLTVAVPFVYRFHPMVREAAARIETGDLGVLHSVTASYLQDWMMRATDDDWRVDETLGGPSRAFADIGSHLCDLIEFVAADRIRRLIASTRTVITDRPTNRAVQTEDLAALLFETETGIVGTAMVSQVAAGRKNRLAVELMGSHASAFFDQETPDLLWLGRRSGSQLLVRDPATLSPDAARLSTLPAGHPMGYQDAFNNFMADAYRAAGGATVPGLPTADDGVRAAELTRAVLESARTGSWSTLDLPAPAPGAAPTPTPAA